MEQRVTLDFACPGCGQAVGVTVQCSGAGLADGCGKATLNVPCPACGAVSHLEFAPDGTVHGVRPHVGRRLPLEPSLN